LQKLPLTVRTALAVHKGASLSELADMADNMAEVEGPQAPVYQLQHCGVFVVIDQITPFYNNNNNML